MKFYVVPQPIVYTYSSSIFGNSSQYSKEGILTIFQKSQNETVRVFENREQAFIYAESITQRAKPATPLGQIGVILTINLDTKPDAEMIKSNCFAYDGNRDYTKVSPNLVSIQYYEMLGSAIPLAALERADFAMQRVAAVDLTAQQSKTCTLL
jgi:hypothetical protein